MNTAIAISLEENMEESLKEIISIYNKLKEEFSSSEYLIIAAQIIFNSKERVNIDDAYIDEVLTALKGEGNVMFRIENADRTVESYLIEVATSNFAELYNAQTGQ